MNIVIAGLQECKYSQNVVNVSLSSFGDLPFMFLSIWLHIFVHPVLPSTYNVAQLSVSYSIKQHALNTIRVPCSACQELRM